MPASIGSSGRPLDAVRAIATRHPLAGFFVLAYGYSWLELGIAGRLGLPAGLVIALTTFAPAAAALTMTALSQGGPAVSALLRRLLIWRVGWVWYAVALAGIPLVYLLATMILRMPFVPMAPVPLLVTFAVTFVIGAILGGPLGEEPGWRGFALPRLQRRFGPLAGTLLLGALWGGWHLPQFLVGDWATQNGGLNAQGIAIFLATVVAIAVILTWLYNRTQGSLLLAVIAHASINTAQAALIDPLFPAAAGNEVNALLGFGVLALLLTVATRGKLGYRDDATAP